MSIEIEYGAGYRVGFHHWQFPGGECGVLLNLDKISYNVGEFIIRWDYESDSEMMAIAQIVDAIRRDKSQSEAKLLLNLPYLPYARQDRVCSPGESHALKVFSTWLNSLKFDGVCVLDPHSYVAEALIDNMSQWSQEEKFKEYLLHRRVTQREGYDVLIAPDAGAAKKVEKCRLVHSEVYGSTPEIRIAHKVRKEGRVVVSLDVSGLTSKRVCVIDDICDGGATFISLAECFNGSHPVEPETLDLYVSHGIFSNESQLKLMAGVRTLDEMESSGNYEISALYNNIITPNLMNKKASDYVTTF